MKRRLLIVAVFLLAGAVVNVAVAWGIALWAPPLPVPVLPSETQQLSQDDAWRLWRTLRPSEWTDPPVLMGHRWGQVGESYVEAWEPLDETPWFSLLRVGKHQFGAPAFSLEYVYQYGDSRESRVGAWTGLRSDYRAGLPLRPVWSGFAVNTFFYAAVLWLLIPGPFVLRRLIRMKRGRCVKCGYPMGESDVCTECGKALPGRTEVAT